MFNRFKLEKYNTSVRQEVLAGLVTFLTISYILFAHPLVLVDAGIPIELSLIATIFTGVASSLLMGLVANVPIVVTPAMGINALFTYTLVQGFGMSWQQAIAVVVAAGLIFILVAYLGIMTNFSKAIPSELKTALTAGIGLFLVAIGLQNSGFIVDGGLSWNWVGFIGIILIFVLSAKQITGNAIIVIIASTILYWVLNPGQEVESTNALSQLGEYTEIFAAMDFSNLFTIESLIGIFSLVMLMVFQDIGMLEAFVPDEERRDQSYKMAAIGGFLSGLFGTSSAIPVAENGAGIQEGGRTGLTAVTASVLFFIALFLAPLFAYIPSQAIGPVIVYTGVSMALSVKEVKVHHGSLWIPVLLIVLLIPLTGSITDGMAYGFIAYPLVAVVFNQKEGLNRTMWVIAALFLIMLVLNSTVAA